jgi:sugar lactone lactonase YvrE
MIEMYCRKKAPKQRLEIDIEPSYLNCSQNKLLIASRQGKIRLIDLFTYKIQKDELKNLLINGIALPKQNDNNNDILYAVTNGHMSDEVDELNVSDSTIIVTRRELKVLKKEADDESDAYVFVDPSGCTFDIYGNLYICDTANNRVKVLDSVMLLINVIEIASSNDDHLNEPRSVGFGKNQLFICDTRNRRVVSYFVLKNGEDFQFNDIYGRELLHYPIDCCVDNKDVLYVRDAETNLIHLFLIDTNVPIHSIELNPSFIFSMTVSETSDIYVAKNNNNKKNKEKASNDVSPNHNNMTNNTKYYIDIY